AYLWPWTLRYKTLRRLLALLRSERRFAAFLLFVVSSAAAAVPSTSRRTLSRSRGGRGGNARNALSSRKAPIPPSIRVPPANLATSLGLARAAACRLPPSR